MISKDAMRMSSSTGPISKTVVLVGAGNAHLVLLKKWGMAPLEGVSLSLINEDALIPYSAMVPAHLMGDFPRARIEMDLVRFCASLGVRFIQGKVTGLAPAAKRVDFADRASLTYDVLSVNVGSVPAATPTVAGTLISLRPLRGLLDRLASVEMALASAKEPYRLVVVGGGASGSELCLSLHRRFRRYPALRMALVNAEPELLSQHPRRVRKIYERLITERGIALYLGNRVAKVTTDALHLERGEELGCNAVLWATQPSPTPLIQSSGLAIDADGFIRVRQSLQSITDPAIFAAGDCAAIDGLPLPRNGVYAVREGAVLSRNIRAYLRDLPLCVYRPQKRYLSLLNTADGKAVLSYGPLVWRSRWAMRLKRKIDRKWMEKFSLELPKRRSDKDKSAAMRCGGCGSKIPSQILHRVLARLPIPEDPSVLIGCRDGEDSAVTRPPPDLVEVQTVDYFKTFLDDPFLFGKIAALHALSDLYAMNASPSTALAIVTLPQASSAILESTLYELLSGALAAFKPAKVTLVGGHTAEGSELALGFSVTGYAKEATLFRKSRLRVGDALLLTKPLGSGALLAAQMRAECTAGWMRSLTESLTQSNGEASRILASLGVEACTDVTGFGLGGHLLEMLDASGLSARLWSEQLPLFPGFRECVERGVLSTLHAENQKISSRIRAGVPIPAVLFDPQTAGGLLFAIPREKANPALRSLHAAGYRDSAVIGEIEEKGRDRRPEIILELGIPIRQREIQSELAQITTEALLQESPGRHNDLFPH